jgi:opacity protein-like surface antigen
MDKPTNINLPPPPPPNVKPQGQPPDTVGTNPEPNQTTTGPESFFQKFHPGDPCNWAGFYIGFNNGATFNNFHLGGHMTDVNLEEQFYEVVPESSGAEQGVFATFDTPGHHGNDTETIGGGQTGFNLQFGHIVIGAEGSFIGNGSSAGGKSHDFQENPLFLETINSNVIADTEFRSMRNVETTWNGFLGGKVGFCWNGFLFYGEAGVAFTDVHFESRDKADTSFFRNCIEGCDGDLPTTGGSVRRVVGPNQPQNNFIGEILSQKTHTQGDVLTGWYGGGGVDYLLTKIVSVGLEYKHVDWGNVTEHQMEGGGPVFPSNANLDVNADQVTFKVNILIGH